MDTDKKPSNKITLQDVARAAEVTIGTASKALHGQGKLRKETRERVLAAAKKLNFRPRGQPVGDCLNILLLTSPHNGRFNLPFLDGLEEGCSSYSHPINVQMCRILHQPDERQRLEALVSGSVHGLIIMEENTNLHQPLAIENNTIPHLYAYTRLANSSALCLLPDDEQGGRLAAEHLLSLGRRELAYITGPLYFEAVHLRGKGMRQTLLERNIPFSERRILSGPWTAQWGHEATRQLLDRDPAVDAIFCGSDEIAFGVIEALQAHGRRVPEDVSVVGFDNWDAMVYRARPHLTTIDMNLHELGRAAARALLAMLEGEETAKGAVYYPCSLVIRDSCGQKRANPHSDGGPD